MRTMAVFQLWLMLVYLSGSKTQLQTSLLPNFTAVDEFTNFTLDCTINEYHNKSEIFIWLWYRKTSSQSNFGRVISVTQNETYFNTIDISLYKVQYDFSRRVCTLEKTVVNRNDHNMNWKCRFSTTTSSAESSASTIYVNVAVKSVKMNYTVTSITVPEIESTFLECYTSYSRPKPDILWYLQDQVSHQTIDITFRSNQTATYDREKLISSRSVITFNPNRTINGWNIYCEASNVPHKTVQSAMKVLYIIYLPNGPPRILGYNHTDTYKIIESEKGHLSCYISGGNPLPTLTWECYNSSTSTRENLTVRSTVSWTAKRGQNKCSCLSTHSISNQSVSVLVDILYPPNKPVFTIDSEKIPLTVKIIRNNTLRIICKSDSNPLADYTWVGQSMSNVNGDILNIVNVTEKGQYTCTVKNTMVDSDNNIENGTNNSSIEVEVLFPPSLIEFRYGNRSGPLIRNNAIDVIRGDTFSIACSANGNPIPDYKWDNEAANHLMNITSVTSSISRICDVSNIMNQTVGQTQIGHASATLSIAVLYPPTTPELYFTTSSTSAMTVAVSLNVQEWDSFNLTCVSKSRPFPSYKWHINNTEITESDSLVLKNISRKESGIYYCNVTNTMDRTFGKSEVGFNISATFLNVLFAADIGVLTNKSIAEGLPLNIPCPVIPGNTNYTDVYWTRVDNRKRWNQTEFIIQNVTREDSMIYTCTIYSVMKPSFGDMTVIERQRQFFLNVYYRASVERFAVKGHENEISIVANESTNITFICEIDSNPSSNVHMTLPNGTELFYADTNIIEYSYHLTSCHDNGLYTCSGSNDHNKGQPGSSSLRLLVNCKPLAYFHIEKDVRSELYTPVTIQFKAIAYPEPAFSWEIETDLSWIRITNTRMFYISSSGLQSNLTVNNFTSSEAIHFRLIAENFMGKLIQHYTLQPFDLPNQPTEFNHLQELLTDTSVTLLWKPAFNGGTPQNFSVFYKSQTEQKWEAIILQDNGDVSMNITIKGLKSNTYYEFQIVATNIKGRSENVTLHVLTKELSRKTEGNSSSLISIVIGCFVAVLVITITSVLTILMYRRYQKKKDKVNERIASYVECTEMTLADGEMPCRNETVYEGIRSEKDRGIIERMECTYEKLRPDKGRDTAEKKEKDFEECKADTDDFGSSIPVYTNLTLQCP